MMSVPNNFSLNFDILKYNKLDMKKANILDQAKKERKCFYAIMAKSTNPSLLMT